MSNGKSAHWEYLKPEFERVLMTKFSVSGVKKIVQLEKHEGKNSDGHFKAQVTDEQWFGFKTYPQAHRNGNQDDKKYAEQDMILARIAQTLNAPNACDIQQVSDISEVPLRGWTVNVVKWLRASEILPRLDSNCLARIRGDGEKFFFEFGQWTAFGIAFGVQDRGAHQFVYNTCDELAMIDMDYCFSNEQQDYRQPLKNLRPFNKSKFEQYEKEFSEGFVKMKSKISQKENEIQLLLKSAVISDLAPVWQISNKLNDQERIVSDIGSFIRAE